MAEHRIGTRTEWQAAREELAHLEMLRETVRSARRSALTWGHADLGNVIQADGARSRHRGPPAGFGLEAGATRNLAALDRHLRLVKLGAGEYFARFTDVVTTGDQHLPALEQDRQRS